MGNNAFLQRWSHLGTWITSNWALSIFFCTVALLCNLYRLAVPGIWFDEAFSVELARQPLPLLWHIIFGLEPNMELYYLLLHVWLAITAFLGILPTEFVVRLPSAIFAALSTGVVFCFGRRFPGRAAGMLAASLYLLNDLQLVYAQQARSYSLQLLLLSLAWYAFCIAVLDENHKRQWWACFVVAMTLAIYAHLFSFFLLLAQLCTFGIWCVLPNPWGNLARQQWRAGLISLICIGILTIPLLPVSLSGLQISRTAWLPVPQLKDIARLFVTIGGDNRVYVLALVVCCGMAFFKCRGRLIVHIADLSALPKQIRVDKSAMCTINRPLRLFPVWESGELQIHVPIAIALLCWLCIPIATSFAISQGPVHLFSSRYLVTVVPPLMLLTALGVTALRWRSLRIVLTLGLLLLALQSVPLYYRSAQVEDWNSASFWVEQHYQAGDGLVCYDNAVEQGCQISVQYYLDAYPGAAHFTADTPGAFSWTTFRSANPEAAVDPTVLTKFGTKYTRIFFIVGRLPNARAAMLARQAQSWLDSHYQFVSQIVTRTVTVRLYKTTP
jgi:4-amino-4-deoxy-L-arabinose transferase-like glycosyltransferase